MVIFLIEMMASNQGNYIFCPNTVFSRLNTYINQVMLLDNIPVSNPQKILSKTLGYITISEQSGVEEIEIIKDNLVLYHAQKSHSFPAVKRQGLRVTVGESLGNVGCGTVRQSVAKPCRQAYLGGFLQKELPNPCGADEAEGAPSDNWLIFENLLLETQIKAISNLPQTKEEIFGEFYARRLTKKLKDIFQAIKYPLGHFISLNNTEIPYEFYICPEESSKNRITFVGTTQDKNVIFKSSYLDENQVELIENRLSLEHLTQLSFL